MTDFTGTGSILWERDYKLFSIAKQRMTFGDMVTDHVAYTLILFNRYIITLTRKPGA